MYVYLIATVLTSILLFIDEKFHTKYKDATDKSIKNRYRWLFILFLVLSIIPYFFVSAFRYGVGTDYFYGYYPGFYQTMAGNDKFFTEIPFDYLMKLLTLITDEAQILFIVTSAIFNIFMILAVIKMTKHWYIGGALILLSNVYLISLNNIRQYCATALCIYAFSFACDRKYIRCLIFAGLGFCFHYTSLCLIPLYLVAGFRKLRSPFFYVLLVLLALSPGFVPLARLILKNTRYISYFVAENDNDIPIYWYMVPSGVVALISLVFYKKLSTINNYAFGLIVGIVIAFGISISSFFLTVNETMSRACNWYYWSVIFIIPLMVDMTKKKDLNLLMASIAVVLVTAGTYYMIVKLGHHEVLPYRWWFDPSIIIWGLLK